MNWYKQAKEKQKFIVRKETPKDMGIEPFGAEDLEMESAYAFSGCYLGDPDKESDFIDKFDLDPNKIESDDCNNVCNY